MSILYEQFLLDSLEVESELIGVNIVADMCREESPLSDRSDWVGIYAPHDHPLVNQYKCADHLGDEEVVTIGELFFNNGMFAVACYITSDRNYVFVLDSNTADEVAELLGVKS